MRSRLFFFILILAGFLAGCNLSLPLKKEAAPVFVEKELEGFKINNEATKTSQMAVSPLPTVSPLPSGSASPAAEKSDRESIKEFFSKKYSRPIEEIFINIEKKAEGYASGTVRFIDEMGGGWWLAAKVGNEWRVVADGNGTVSCSSIEGYNFPADIVPECYDHESGEMVDRK